jgi:hypothetical protein
MNSFISAMKTNDTQTTNGMLSHSTTGKHLLDFFFASGASRKNDLTSLFQAAWKENATLAAKSLFYCRDVRKGQGEREQFRKLVKFISSDLEMANKFKRNIQFIPEFGRWDDIVELLGTSFENEALQTIKTGLDSGNGLCAKWMPRKGPESIKIRNFLELSPKQYRKLIVSLSKTVEQQMCAKKWNEINYSHVPSKAAKIYQKAFMRNDPKRYQEYADALTKGDKTVKINASAIFPHEILFSTNTIQMINNQWKALPDFMKDSKNKNILPVCDVSGSMSGLPMSVCVSLGLYCAERNRGSFKDIIVTFDSNPTFFEVSDSCIVKRKEKLMRAPWGMSTNLEAVFDIMLKRAKDSNLSQEDMPDMILIMSDMQFNSCVAFPSNASDMIRKKYEASGYKVPNVVFWNLNAHLGTNPVKINESGFALVSGFSPSVLKNILSGEVTPEAIFNRTVGENSRYENIYVN